MLYDHQTLSEERLMQVKDDGDLHGGQRSTEVKYVKQYMPYLYDI